MYFLNNIQIDASVLYLHNINIIIIQYPVLGTGDPGSNPVAVSYTHLDVYKRQV